MVVSNSLKKNSLLKQLESLYPSINFVADELFRWAPNENCVYYEADALDDPEGQYNMLHELAHAVLGHKTYTYDVSLVQMEAEAWKESYTLGEALGVDVSEEYAEEAIDTYRGWLAGRSTCPACRMIGIQKDKNTYQCVNCRCFWRVNDAKFCALRRFRLD